MNDKPDGFREIVENYKVMFAVVIAILVVFAFIKIITTSSDGCTVSGDPGSAQYDRDRQHCIEDRP